MHDHLRRNHAQGDGRLLCHPNSGAPPTGFCLGLVVRCQEAWALAERKACKVSEARHVVQISRGPGLRGAFDLAWGFPVAPLGPPHFWPSNFFDGSAPAASIGVRTTGDTAWKDV